MKKIFIVTPFHTEYFRTETINNYVAQMASIARGYLQDEEIEVHTNFFLEPDGVDEDGTPITKLRNSDNMIAYLMEELETIAKCDAVFKQDWYPYIGNECIVTPFDYQLDKYFFGNSIPIYRLVDIKLEPDYLPDEEGTLQLAEAVMPQNMRIAR